MVENNRYYLLKKVLLVSTFFLPIVLWADDCQPQGKLTNAVVQWVYDGDTLRLKSKQNIRLRVIGIDTPEVARKGKLAEPLSGEAKEAVRELLSGEGYRIRYERDVLEKDRYGRLLAHVYTQDNINLSQWLLQKGLATTLFIPPSERHVKCYQRAEQQAQEARLGLWRLPAFQLQDSTTIKRSVKGYVRIEGTVLKIESRSNKLTLVLALFASDRLRVVIKKPELTLFKNKDLSHLKGSRVHVTGILYRYGKRAYIRVRHPAYLHVLSP